MFSYYGIKQNVICSGKWAFATPRNGICPTKWGLALRGKPFARQNGASCVAGRHLSDKTGPRVAREDICPTKRGLARSRNAIWSTKWDLVNPRTITHPLISYISRSSTPDCPPHRASRRSPSMGRGAYRRCRPRRDRGRKVFP